MSPRDAGRAVELEGPDEVAGGTVVGDRRPDLQAAEDDGRRRQEAQRAPAGAAERTVAGRGRAAGPAQRWGEQIEDHGSRRGAPPVTGGHRIATIPCVSSDNSGHPHLHWLADPLVLVPLALFAGIYVWRFAQARKEVGASASARGVGPLQALAFAGGMLALLVALVSPLDGLGDDYLFSAHMVQHVLIGDVAPLLILLGLSRVIMRPATRRLTSVERRLGPLASPATGIALWLVLMYLWHIPALYDAAAEHPLRAPARARLLLRRRRGALVAADPARPDAAAGSPACSRSRTSARRRPASRRSASS